MLFISLVSLSHKDIRYKLFAYTTVYYLLYLTSVFLPTDVLTQNIGYSLFSYIIIVTVLSFLISHIEHQKKELGIYSAGGILCYMPRTSKCLSLFVLAGIGLPVTSLFWNNFLIISEIFNYNLIFGNNGNAVFVYGGVVAVGRIVSDERQKQRSVSLYSGGGFAQSPFCRLYWLPVDIVLFVF